MSAQRSKPQQQAVTLPSGTATPPAPASRAWSLPLLAALVTALVVRVVALVQLADHPLLQPEGGLDPAAYVRLARQAAAGDWSLGPEPYFVSPLYVYFLAAVFRVLGPSLLLPKLLQVLLGTLAVGLAAATARRLFSSSAVALATAWLGALAGVIVFHEILLLQSSLDPFLAALALYALVRAVDADRWPAFVAAGAAFGLLAANRPNALVVTLVVATTFALLRRSPRALAQAGALAVGALLLLAPFAVRNRLVSGEWILVSSHGGLNFYIGNNAEADGTYHAVPGITPAIEGQARDAARVASAALGHPASATEVSRHFYVRALSWMRAEPAAALRLLLRKIGTLLNATEVPLNYSYAYYSRDEPTVLRLLVVGSWLLLPLGLLGLVVHPPLRDRVAFGTWASFVPAYALTVAVFFVSARYRLALLVPVATAAGAALVQLASWARARRWRPLALAAVVLVALSGLATLDLGLDDGRGHEAGEMVLHHLKAGRDEAARELLAKTEPLLDNPGLLHYRIGLVELERGRHEAAVQAFGLALEADPGQADIRLSLGQALMLLGREREAEPHLRAARDAGVSMTEAGYGLSRALAASGRRDEAIVELRRAAADAAREEGSALPIGLLASQLGAADVAEQALRTAARQQPGSAEAHEALGLLLAQTGRAEEASHELLSACRLDAARASARFNLAVLALRSGRPDVAGPLLAEAVAIQPEYPQARALLEQLSAPPPAAPQRRR